ncbi:DUF6233 domain-containing protein [Streptomyces griseofuscus]|uniref:DUF6233 domain-containing protein n=1 Tax=Streptomyces griseofuscus TaxID=146922 RepID=UPI0011887CD1|nr:hypothetical protein SRO_0066 [Streptomyces rochei]
MSGLPPESARLRAILAYLERQIAETETVGIYLRRECHAVRKALAHAQTSSGPGRDREVRESRPWPPSAQYLMETKLNPKDPLPVTVHVGDCTSRQGRRTPAEISAEQARLVLAVTVIGAEPRPICRPETKLGIDLA